VEAEGAGATVEADMENAEELMETGRWKEAKEAARGVGGEWTVHRGVAPARASRRRRQRI
jgi:hypothetical protein